MTRDTKTAISLPTVRRLPMYYSILQEAASGKQENISSSQIAGRLQLESIQVRKDLASIGITGLPRIGFSVARLMDAIEDFLGWNNTSDAVVIGAGHLGSALAGYKGFAEKGLDIFAFFDSDKTKIGQKIQGKEVLDIERLPELTRRMHINIAILTVPDHAAQNAADVAIKAGIKAIWNFTLTKIIVPSGTIVERVDLAASLAALSSKLRQQIA